ncbi:LacI family transcriptional regulator [Puniceicoccaceae bacterium K14]|nr:LacI family transcriptional regulator [Puniceicoccaceae bacterium K14]
MTNNPLSEKTHKRRVTLREIADELGISHSSVSRALRNNPSISESLRAKVQNKAEELGYTPDPLLSALSHYRLTSKTKPIKSALAWINPWSNPKKFRENKEFELYWQGAQEAAKRMGFTLEEFSTSKTPLTRLERILKARNILGVLIGPSHDLSKDGTPVDLVDFPWKDFAVVRFGRSIALPHAHFVSSAQTANTLSSFNTISKKGYRRIGYAGILRSMRAFGSGFHMAQQYVPASRRLLPLYFDEDISIYKQIDRLASWVEKSNPDAIITDGSHLLHMLPDLGYKIPEDIALATTSIHDTLIDAGIDQNPREIGRTAIRTLVGLLNEQNFGIPQNRTAILIEGTWVNGSMLPGRK